MLSGKKVLLGVSASIAAYKSAFIVRAFIKAGAEVRVVLTPASLDFVTPLTLSTLSKNEVHVHFTNPEKDTAVWTNHVELGLWADLMVIAPATSNTLAKMVSGACDNLLLATYRSAKCPVYFAPAMDLDMYKHPATTECIEKLNGFGNKFIKPGVGELASGLEGEGRMAEPEEILAFVEADLLAQSPLNGKTVLINAGPTYEPIDAVRVIGNHSTGKMGVAIAQVAMELGAKVHLVLGPTSYPHQTQGMEVTRVQTAAEMLQACSAVFPHADIAIFTAAVADYTPETTTHQKIKKQDAPLVVTLKPTVDILGKLAHQKQPHQTVVGFALESQNEMAYAKDKLVRKNLDFIVLNSLQDPGAGFGFDTNKVQIINKELQVTALPLQSKNSIAKALWNYLLPQLTK
jgi:phosphopantothenoylcysteine decarboxylase/phosphopantothenate--cysteine ligase